MKLKKKIPLIDQHDKNGFWGGKFGGNFIPETLKKPVEDLTNEFKKLRKDQKFLKKRDFYFKNWEKAPFTWNENKTKEEKLKSSDLYYKKPEFLDDLIIFSEKLSAKFAYVRVDWYDCGDEFYFGELTFHHDSGYVPILPKEWDLFFGKKLILKYI